jgi:hypothetical protein
VRADGRRSGRRRLQDGRRRRGKDARHLRHARWLYRKGVLRLPRFRRQALNRIERALVAEDPRLNLLFAFFAGLTQEEAIPATEQVPDRLAGAMRRVALLPLLACSLAALVACSLLIPGNGHACHTASNVAARDLSVLSRAAHCQPDPAVKLGTIPMH